MRSGVRVLAFVLSLVFLFALSTPASAVKLGTRPNWGACGVSTASSKVVYDFGSIFELQCGTSSWGYRHVKARHMDDFSNLARPAGLNWSDLVHWAIYYTVRDPDRTVVEGNSGCRDRVLYGHNRDGKLVIQQRFKVIYNATDGRVITVYPTSSRC